MKYEMVELKTLVGKKIAGITGLEKESKNVSFFTDDGNEYRFTHIQGCGETVSLNDFEGSAQDLIDATVLSADEVTGEEPALCGEIESYTWTFYKIETNKGGLWMRWLSELKGYYSEAVDFIWVNKPRVEAL
jgi:hypothetical protein